jgi:hypothetical protein
MSFVPPDLYQSAANSSSFDYQERDDWYQERGSGWTSFAGVLLLIVGTLNLIEGIAAIGNAHFFVHDANYVFGTLKTWGWIATFAGAIQLVVGVGVIIRNQFARWVGVFILAVGALVALLMMPAYPFWSLSLFALDILAIYGLIAHGSRKADA